MKKIVRLLSAIPLIVAVVLLSPSQIKFIEPKQTEYDYTANVFKVYNTTFASATSLCPLYGGFGGIYRAPDGDIHRLVVVLTNFDCSMNHATYTAYLKSGAVQASTLIDVPNNISPGVNFIGELVYYPYLAKWDGSVGYAKTSIAAISFYDYTYKMPLAWVLLSQYGATSWAPSSFNILVNLTNMTGTVYKPPADINKLFIRTFVTPYTKAPAVGVFFNYPDILFIAGMINDADGIKTTIYSAAPTDYVATPQVTYLNTIIIPIGYLYSQDRSWIYLFALTITQSDPNVVGVDYFIFTNTGGFLTATQATTVTLPINFYYPDIEVFYLNTPEFTQTTGGFITATPIKVALYSPTAQKIVFIDIDINATIVNPTTYDIQITMSVSSILDISAVTGGDYNKAKLTVIDLFHPKYIVTGPLVYRQTAYDSDVFLNPFGFKAWLYNGQWYSYKYKDDIIPKASYYYPKVNVMPDYPAFYGQGSPILMDLQVYSNDGTTATGFEVNAVYLLPYTKYDVTPTKFTYTITYNYYITPITITYVPADPSQPANLTNVLVRIVINNPYNIIATADARDVRFFTTNTYGGDYFLYKGLDYAIESINSTQAVFLVLIPQLQANVPITIYMYSGFKYAQPVAKDYFTMISTYPVLVTG